MYLKNNFYWDWGMVAQLDPEYAKKYLYNYEIANNDNDDYISTSSRPIIEDDDELLPEEVNSLQEEPTPYIRTNGNKYTEEELAIIKEMIGTSAQKSMPVKIQLADDDELLPEIANITKTESRSYSTEDSDKKTKHRLWKTNNKAISDLLAMWCLKDEYIKQPNVPTKGYIELPPPASVMKPGTFYMFRDNAIKHVTYPDKGECLPYALIWETYEGMIDTPEKISIYKHVRLKNRLSGGFDKISNPKGFEKLIFNKKTGTLYHLTKESINGKKNTKARYKTVVRQYTTALINFVPMRHHPFFNKFYLTIIDTVLAKVPDAITVLTYMPTYGDSKFNILIPKSSTDINHTLFGLILQFKVGKRIPWLVDTEFLDKLGAARKLKNKKGKPFTTGLVRQLRKTISTKSLLKHFYKEDFENIFVKLWSLHITSVELINDMLHPENKDWYNEIKYYISTVVNLKDIQYIDEFMNVYRLNKQTSTEYQIENRHYAKLYLKHIYNLNFPHESNTNDHIQWVTFRDTLRMAKNIEYGRVHMSRIDTPYKIRKLHDKLAYFQRRDLEALRNLSQYKFLPFALPEKEYNKFRFVQLLNVDELVEEGTTMKQCVGGYGEDCLCGDSIIVSMKNGRSWATIELDGTDYSIRQKFSIGDNKINNNKFLDIINQWHKDVMELHKHESRKDKYINLAMASYEHQKDAIIQNTCSVKNSIDELPEEI